MARIRISRIVLLSALFILLNLKFSSIAQPNKTKPLEYKIIRAEELLEKIKKNTKLNLIDCRPTDEYRTGHIPGAINVSFDSYEFGNNTVIKKAMNEILSDTGEEIHFILIDSEIGEEYMPKTKLIEFLQHLPQDRNEEVIFYCRRPTCIRSPMAASWAVALGYTNVFRYEGSWKDWSEKKYPIKK